MILKYFFKYLVQFSNFYANILPRGNNIYVDASYLYNFQAACYNLISKKNHKYFIDPVTYKFQYGGNRRFYMKYLDYFQELEELFNKENIINLDFFKDQNNFEDFYKKIIRFQRTMLAKTHIPLDYYKAIANGNKDVKSFNPIRNLEFFISPYFEFYKIGNEYYNLTLKYSLKNTKNYCILRFPKKILIDYNNLNKIVDDFRDSKGILLNILNLNEYDIGDLKLYFENLIDLIYKFSSNGQKVILMNNSEFGKYFKYFGLDSVCSNVMIGQTSREYIPFKQEKKGGSSNFIYIPEVDRSISITNAESLLKRNKEIKRPINKSSEKYSLDSRTELYYNSLEEKLEEISKSSIQRIIEKITSIFNKIEYDLHKKKYEYIKVWKEILLKKTNQYSINS